MLVAARAEASNSGRGGLFTASLLPSFSETEYSRLPLVSCGKKPPNIRAWVLAKDAPALVRWDGPLNTDGPVWRMELAIPAVWPDTTGVPRQKSNRH
jgi:hypothetical protein